MRARTRAGVSLLGVLAMTVLSSCEKPRPGITVVSGTSSIRIDAACWGRDDDATVTLATCTGENRELRVSPGDTIGISVDKDVAEAGWQPAIGNAALVREPLDRNYYRFALSEQDLAQGALVLRVIAVDKTGKNARGLWSLALRRAG